MSLPALPSCARWISVARGKPVACPRDAVGTCPEHGAACGTHSNISPARGRICDRCSAPLAPFPATEAQPIA